MHALLHDHAGMCCIGAIITLTVYIYMLTCALICMLVVSEISTWYSVMEMILELVITAEAGAEAAEVMSLLVVQTADVGVPHVKPERCENAAYCVLQSEFLLDLVEWSAPMMWSSHAKTKL